jgi:hypothetical protein
MSTLPSVPSDNENPLADRHAWEGCRAVVNRFFAQHMQRRYGTTTNTSTDIPEESHSGEYATSDARIHKLASGKFILLESSSNLPPLEQSLLPSMAQDMAKRGHVKSAGVFAEWYLKPKAPDNPDNAILEMWRQIIKQPTIPYRRSERHDVLSHAFEELGEEVAAWEKIFKDRNESQAGTADKDSGGYPNFTRANQVKQYLRKCGVTLTINARNLKSPWMGNNDYFAVYVLCTREELMRINPDTPATGDPFEDVTYDYNLLPGFDQIKDLLEGSNAGLAGVLSPHEE